MPTLIPYVWTAVLPSVPYVWSCSECYAAFDMGPLGHSSPSQNQINLINLQFLVHCKKVHPRSTVVNCLGRAANLQYIFERVPIHVQQDVQL